MSNLFVIIVTYAVSIEKIDENLQEHRNYLKQGYDAQFLLASGSQNPRTGGIIIGKFKDRRAAENFTHKDPFFQNGLATYQIIEFSPALHSELLTDFLKA